jgi:poly(3-hydroxybutyrate) depolymerase
MLELWMIEGLGHAWSGGHAAGTYTESEGPNASVQIVRFFLAGRAGVGLSKHGEASLRRR